MWNVSLLGGSRQGMRNNHYLLKSSCVPSTLHELSCYHHVIEDWGSGCPNSACAEARPNPGLSDWFWGCASTVRWGTATQDQLCKTRYCVDIVWLLQTLDTHLKASPENFQSPVDTIPVLPQDTNWSSETFQQGVFAERRAEALGNGDNSCFTSRRR